MGCFSSELASTVNANAEQKARLLGAKVRENSSTIEQLRQERSILARDHKDLQQRYAQASEVGFLPRLFSLPDAHVLPLASP